jgi:hypothetical protein
MAVYSAQRGHQMMNSELLRFEDMVGALSIGFEQYSFCQYYWASFSVTIILWKSGKLQLINRIFD